MGTQGIYKLDDGNSFPTNCFPARNLMRPRYEEGAGHWQVARLTAEQTRIELLLGPRPPNIQWKQGKVLRGILRHLDEKTLDGAQLIQLHHVKSPSDLCSVDVSNQNFSSTKEEDFEEFTSVAYINATENLLSLDAFRKFPELRELELSLNGLRNLKVIAGDFPHLEVLDLSYNNLSPEDVRILGVLSHLKVLHLTANGLNSLPLDLAIPESEGCLRFPALEVLLLDDNHLSHPNVFVSLANLQSLKQLNLDRNGIREIPYLQYVDSSHFSIHPLSAKSGIREGLRSRKKARKRLRRDKSLKERDVPEYIIVQNSKDPDRTEVVFPSWTPEPPAQEPSPSPRPDSKASCCSDDPEFTLPLPELRFLSLADNQIVHEEDVLAVALFPSLTEVTFYGNPFTTSRRGDPPLLTSFLQNKLGIKLVRKKISKLEKPRIFIPIKANRKVKSRLPKVRKRSQEAEAEKASETTFWQVWTGADLDPRKLQPLPSIKSLEYDPSQPILLTLNPEDRSMPYSLSSSFTEEDLSAFQVSADQLEFIPESIPSLNQWLFSKIGEAQSSVEQALTLRREEQDPREFAEQIGRLLADEGLGNLEEEDHPESGLPTGTPSVEKGVTESTPPPSLSPVARQDQVESTLPLHLPSQEQDLSDLVLPSGSCTAERDLSQTLPLATSEEEQLPQVPLPISALQEKSLSETVLPMNSPVGEQSPFKFLSPAVSSILEDEQLEAMLLASFSTQGLVGSECGSLSGSSAGDLSQDISPDTSPIDDGQVEPSPSHGAQDLAELLPPHGSPMAEKDQSIPLPSTSSVLQEQKFSKLARPSGSLRGEEDLMGSLSLPVEPDLPEEEDLPASPTTYEEPEPQMSSTSVLEAEEPSEPSVLQKISSEVLLPSRSSSRELFQLFEQARLSATIDDQFPSEADLFNIDEEILGDKKSESFFMTQVDEGPSPPLKPAEPPKEEKIRKFRVVLEKYKGYEELLGGDPGPDFVEPVGIQHNVQALEKALRYPRVYRESKARLDSFQKPYTPSEKKILRVPKPRKTKVEELKEILLEMRKPTNIIHMPLVCVLRQKKGNWRDYQKALELLKEFRKEYQAAVAICNQQEKTKLVSKGAVADKTDQSREPGSPLEIKASRPWIQKTPAKEFSVSFEEQPDQEN